ncbi:MAG: crossover junction endodeoxyribonuclease RuvC [Calditrichaeota bacterium]|nr:crossover junction endodeoxyribonuclease RuvC [Calditrichota bacterium]
MKILGIDPGIHITGYGLIEIAGAESPHMFVYGHIRTNSKQQLAERVFKIYSEVKKLIAEHSPEVMVMESIFYAKNVKTAITMGHVRGAVMVAAIERDVPVFEYSPREIKLSVVGNGAAGKNQVNFMVRRILNTSEIIEPADASDALAAALCHWHRIKIY